MKKITNESINKFLAREVYNKSNTEVVKEGSIYYLKLFGNKIAAIEADDRLWISDAGWDTKTTKERLNGLPGVSIQQKSRKWYLNGILWDGQPIYVNRI